MKKTVSLILAVLMLGGVFGFTASAETEFQGEVGEVICPYLAGDAPTIDGVISAGERWSDPSLVNNLNTAPTWAYRSRCLVSIKMYYAWDENGMYVAGEINDPTLTLSTDYDTTDGAGDISADSYGGNGDLLIFALDPLSVIAKRGDSNSDNVIDTAWYNIVPMAGDTFKMCRTRYNSGDITSSVRGAVKTGDGSWSFECVIPWSIIIADTIAAGSNSIVPPSSSDIAAITSTNKATVIYMDRAEYHTSDIYSGYHVGYLPDGTIFTISRNITVATYMPDGNPGYYGNGIDATIYGISLYFEEGKIFTSGNFKYIYTQNNSSTKLIGYTGGGGHYSLPGTLGGKTVTAIRDKAFNKVSALKIFIPASVTDIEDDAFFFCASLKLFVERGSAAHNYAVDKNINYQIVCETHTPGDWQITEPSTCLKKGMKVKLCTVCGIQLSSVEIPYVEHEPGQWEIQTKATCLTTGLKVLKCTLCGTVMESEQYQSGEHSYTPWLYSALPLCDGGYKKRTCTLCGKTEQSTENVSGCVGGKWVCALEATAEKSGIMARQCIYCGKILEARLTGTLGEPISPFSDVTYESWFFSSVGYVFDNGYMNGIGNGCFAPYSMITRGMFATLLANLSGADLSEYTASPFGDVPGGKYYSAPIAWASSVGIISGYSDGSFKPDTYITRQETAALMYNYTKYLSLDVEVSGDPLSGFSDSALIHNYAIPACKWAASRGVINGDDLGRFSPSAPITRAEVSQLIKNYCEEILGR